MARHDYYPFGESVQAGVGQRTSGQGFGATDQFRSRFAGTEGDAGTGLEHTLWRKMESRSGRWTSVDPYRGSMRRGDPQSFNRYSYVGNDPINFTDPSGLFLAGPNTRYSNITISGVINESVTVVDSYDASISFFGGSVFGRVVEAGLDPGGGFVDYGGGEIGDFGGILPDPQTPTSPQLQSAINSATSALTRESCRNLFSSLINPITLLNNLASGNAGIGSIRFADLRPPQGGTVTAAETTPILGSRTVTRPDGTTFRQSMIRGATITINSNPAAPFQAGYGGRFGVSEEVNRAITLIHELGHAANLIYGANSSGITNDPPGLLGGIASRLNSERIFKDCFEGYSQ